jgi:hypothetical protein
MLLGDIMQSVYELTSRYLCPCVLCLCCRCDDEKVTVVTESDVRNIEGYMFTYIRRD